jgi:hypothetical protein
VVLWRAGRSRASKDIGLITNAAPLTSHVLDLVGEHPPVFGRFLERSLGFGLASLIRQFLALNGLGAKIVCPLHGKPLDCAKQNPAGGLKFKRNPP